MPNKWYEGWETTIASFVFLMVLCIFIGIMLFSTTDGFKTYYGESQPENVFFNQVFMNNKTDWAFVLDDGKIERISWGYFNKFHCPKYETIILYDVIENQRPWAVVVRCEFKERDADSPNRWSVVKEIHLHPKEKISAGSYDYKSGKFSWTHVGWKEVK